MNVDPLAASRLLIALIIQPKHLIRGDVNETRLSILIMLSMRRVAAGVWGIRRSLAFAEET